MTATRYGQGTDHTQDAATATLEALEDAGIVAAPEHASEDVLDHVRSTDEPVFDCGHAADMLRVAYALGRLASLEAV